MLLWSLSRELVFYSHCFVSKPESRVLFVLSTILVQYCLEASRKTHAGCRLMIAEVHDLLFWASLTKKCWAGLGCADFRQSWIPSVSDVFSISVRHFLQALEQGDHLFYYFDREWLKCLPFYVHILYFCAVQGGCGGFDIGVSWILELPAGHGRHCSVLPVTKNSGCLLCVHGFISSGILSFHCLGFSVLIDSFYAEIKEKACNRIIPLQRDFLTDVLITTEILEYLLNIFSTPFQVLFFTLLFSPCTTVQLKHVWIFWWTGCINTLTIRIKELMPTVM